MKNFQKILSYIFPKYLKNSVLTFVFTLFAVVFGVFSFTMVIPFLQILFERQEMVTHAVPFAFSMDSVTHNFYFYMSEVVRIYGKMSALFYVSGVMLVAVLLKTGFQYMARYVLPPLLAGVIYDMRNDLYLKLLKLPMGYYSNERKGDVISRMTNDMTEIEASIIRSIDVLFKEPVTIAIYLIALINLSPRLTIFVFILLPVSGLIIGRVGRTLRNSARIAQSKLGDLITLIEETLGGLKIIKAFNAQDKMGQRFINENTKYTNTLIKMWRRRDLASPLSEFLGTAVVVVILSFGGVMVLKQTGGFTPELLIGYLVIFSQILNPAKAFSVAYYNIIKGLASIERVQSILTANISIIDHPNAKLKSSFDSFIEYKNVNFKYAAEPVLNNINLKINKGMTVALVGQSGSGKSTLVDLLPRFYDINSGQIIIDGIDIREITMHDLRNLMGIVNQESILFNDTIYNNIAFGVQNANPDKVIEAAKIANAHGFIMETPDGYQSNIGDRGSKLSGGQRQRLSIARAVLANPPILILDEATSALDTESEKLVQESLNRLMQNRTSIIIAHRLSTVVHADIICVLHEGQIVEMGNHSQLLQLNGQYKKLHDFQMFA